MCGVVGMAPLKMEISMCSLTFTVLNLRDFNIIRCISPTSVIFIKILDTRIGLYETIKRDTALTVCRNDDVLQALNLACEL